MGRQDKTVRPQPAQATKPVDPDRLREDMLRLRTKIAGHAAPFTIEEILTLRDDGRR